MTGHLTPREGSTRTRFANECARTYGVEARCHHFDRDWEDVRTSLAAGWDRVRGHDGADWSAVEADVRAAWLCTGLRDR